MEDEECIWYTEFAENGSENLITRENATIKAFQPNMSLPEGAFETPINCPHIEILSHSFHPWEDPNLLWPGRSSVGPPDADGTNITLPENTILLVSSSSFVSTETSVTKS